VRWFRKGKPSEEVAPPEPAAAPPVEAAQEQQAQDDPEKKPRRRRGSRGGRGRKKKTETAAATAVTEKSRKEEAAKPRRKRAPARKPSSTGARSAAVDLEKEILVSVDVGEQRVAVLEDGVVAEVYLERPGHRSIAGNVYKGVVDNVLPGMEASFVDIGLAKNGFLYVDEIVVPELEGRKHGRRIQELVERGQEVLVQAVKDPMGTKGARLTTEVSLPGRFLVFVPFGDGIGVSRRLEDDERERLKAICKELELPEGGLIVRTAAEGASREELEGDLALLQKLWSSIRGRANRAEAPALVYQESELPLRIVRDLFIRNFKRVVVDHDRTYRRIVGYLKRTSPELAARVELYRDKEPLMERYGVDDAVRSTLGRRIDLPSGGYLIFDYAEAFTVIDVNTGRFVGARGKGSQGRLEDTITKNNLEAVKEVVRQLRLRDIGGIIVIDFIDMANPKNRQLVEGALNPELGRDRTKTYVVEISPLGLVEMTRQNV
jgi:ribonuclease G